MSVSRCCRWRFAIGADDPRVRFLRPRFFVAYLVSIAVFGLCRAIDLANAVMRVMKMFPMLLWAYSVRMRTGGKVDVLIGRRV